MSMVEDELKAARGRLLDLTLRNRLLNYRPANARAIRVVETSYQDRFLISLWFKRRR